MRLGLASLRCRFASCARICCSVIFAGIRANTGVIRGSAIAVSDGHSSALPPHGREKLVFHFEGTEGGPSNQSFSQRSVAND